MDWVTHEGSSYACINKDGAPAGTPPADTGCWALLAQRGDMGLTGEQGPQGEQGPEGPPGSSGIGFINAFGGSVVPAKHLLCDGSEIGRSEYPELFAAIGTTWGEGDGVETFNLPDLRDYFLRGAGGANAAALGAAQTDAMRNFTGYFGIRVFYGNGGTAVADGGIFYTNGLVGGNANNIAAANDMRQCMRIDLNPARRVPTAAENRPMNKAVNFCICYE